VVVYQNIRVIAKYYTRITLTRLTTLLDLDASQTEKTLCRLVYQARYGRESTDQLASELPE